jgi:hypothetical protein
MEKTAEKTSLEREVAIAASPETVWEFLVDPQKATRWMGQECSFDPRPGGLYECAVIPGHMARASSSRPTRRGGPIHVGREPGEDGLNPVPPGPSTTEIETCLTARGRGSFTHRDLPSEESAESHSHGWDHHL